jgi:hypothetical protein
MELLSSGSYTVGQFPFFHSSDDDNRDVKMFICLWNLIAERRGD